MNDSGYDKMILQTYSGHIIDLNDLNVWDINLFDIAHALAMQCRFNGHCARFYSVAEHCVLVSKLVSPEYALSGLLHDAAEAYICDVPRPIKPFLQNYKEIENTVQSEICKSFHIPFPIPDEVMKMDLALLGDEYDKLMKKNNEMVWYLPEPRTGTKIKCYNPKKAKKLFMKTYYKLIGHK